MEKHDRQIFVSRERMKGIIVSGKNDEKRRMISFHKFRNSDSFISCSIRNDRHEKKNNK